ncbi:hypothetical protein BV22DRAFT_1050950 [Leucogyrophana mollusca]|uniref:Uncharacterized protein n=1 Tax=Leucogyrophana mollusca TaxID=85980 RepID=A0ACB8B1N5_9AGAM|nr:hypothetical protein BV22DRAFT_1050950 [Leucogyrophana mollusca]
MFNNFLGEALSPPKLFFLGGYPPVPLPPLGADCFPFLESRAPYHGILPSWRRFAQRSGGAYSLERGADIWAADKAAWNAFVKVFTLIKIQKRLASEFHKFRNKGWAHFDAMHELMLSQGKGANVHHSTGFGNDQDDLDPAAEDSTDQPNVEDSLVDLDPTIQSSHVPNPSAAPTSSASSSKQKLDDNTSDDSMSSVRPPSSSCTDTSSAKSLRLTTPVALNRVGDQLSLLNDNFKRNTNVMSESINRMYQPSAQQTQPSISDHKTHALQLVLWKEVEKLTNDQMVVLMDVFQRDVAAADSYVALESDNFESLRDAWVRKHLVENGISM